MEHLLTPVVTRCLDHLFPLNTLFLRSVCLLLHKLNAVVTVHRSFIKSCVC